MVPLSRPTQIMMPPSIKLGHGSQIVTLRSPGSNASFGNSNASLGNGNAAAGKIVNLPGGGLNKTGAPQTTKLDGAAKHVDDRPTKLLSQSRTNQRPARLSRPNFGMPPRKAGRNFNMASTHGSSFRPQFRPGGGGFGGGGFGGGGFGRR
jgi:hypothetical protein